jgi:uncharacterized membrane protein
MAARKFVVFAALFFVALVAGAAFAIWFDYNPSGMSATFYTEKMQHAIRVFTMPLPIIVILGALFTIAAAFLARFERPNFYLLIAASVCMIAVALITRFGNIPINNQIVAWSINSPPSNWADLAQKWWQLQTVRTVLAMGGLSFLILGALTWPSMSK